MVTYINDNIKQLDLIICLAYFDLLGISILNKKQRTTLERYRKQLLKDLNDYLNDVNNNRDSQTNST
ncbi:unnamed protein product [Rotaria sp. Silwood2]|nr:unnamed protein product [Rotaria sp. Silwood2]CAF2521747.1 unnamed protein product [Rotaria sp. Silwood2]CAF3380883.1 unnamed protein product [Rotaria sp. Silwood2]CAF3937728.1 unnamed protein product [Rotaria sp. Silwood2]CAF3996709.1 unnamed protein product [Rotaria sp. Silwood2]